MEADHAASTAAPLRTPAIDPVLLRELVAYLRHEGATLRQEWVGRITDAGLLVRIDREGRREVLVSGPLRHERVHVRGVRRIVERDERRVHVARRMGRCRPQQEPRRSDQLQHA